MSNLSPIKMAFSITLWSIGVRVIGYLIRLSVFPSSGVIISFSSGIIILFCYCAIINNFEKKNKNNTYILIIPLLLIGALWNREITSIGNNRWVVRFIQSPFLCRAILIVVVSIIRINKALFNPSKTLHTTY